jgi:hypothetical protein
MPALFAANEGKPAARPVTLWSRPLRPATQEALSGYLAISPWIRCQ